MKVYTYGSDDKNLMVFGTVGVEAAGSKNTKEWAGRYEIVQAGHALKFKYVQIFVVSFISHLIPTNEETDEIPHRLIYEMLKHWLGDFGLDCTPPLWR